MATLAIIQGQVLKLVYQIFGFLPIRELCPQLVQAAFHRFLVRVIHGDSFLGDGQSGTHGCANLVRGKLFYILHRLREARLRRPKRRVSSKILRSDPSLVIGLTKVRDA